MYCTKGKQCSRNFFFIHIMYGLGCNVKHITVVQFENQCSKAMSVNRSFVKDQQPICPEIMVSNINLQALI